MIDIYSCQPGGVKACDVKMNTSDMLVSTFVYEKTANVRDYEDPITQVNREVNMIIPSAGLRYERVYHLGWTDIITDKGFLTSDIETKKMITLFDSEATAMEKSLKNIPLNFGSQGRIIYADLDIHIEIMTSNEKVEIYRRYLSVIDAMSAVGG
jgi:hypothetical protein